MKARLLSVIIHIGFIALLLDVHSRSTLVNNQSAPALDRRFVRLVLPSSLRGGGGGGDRSPMPASRGHLPKFARQQFTPPSVTPPAHPLLEMEPVLIAAMDVHLPGVTLPNWATHSASQVRRPMVRAAGAGLETATEEESATSAARDLAPMTAAVSAASALSAAA